MGWSRSHPRDLAIRLLAELFAGEGRAAEPAPSLPLTAFQKAAVGRAAATLTRHGGVVIADSVGMGKTYVALELVGRALREGEAAAVIAPAALRAKWRSALRLLVSAATSEVVVDLVSDATLSRGTHPERLARADLLVVDEAHRFRSPHTRRYAALARLAAGRDHARAPRLLLLTATPVNNDPADLYHLLRLFAADDAFRGLGVPSMMEAFGVAPHSGTRPPADLAGVRRITRGVVIRRTRRDVAAVGKPPAPAPALAFPRRARPRVVRYDGRVLAEAARTIAELELRAHAAAAAGAGWTRDAGAARSDHAGAAALIRMGLLKRLESGRAAATISIERHLSFLDAFNAAAEEGRLLRIARARKRPGGDADPAQLLLLGVVAAPAPARVDLPRLLASGARDRARLRRLLELLAGPDPKIERCLALARAIAAERVVVFTEFRDTAAALWRALASHVRVARVDGDGAWLGARRSDRDVVLARFAPHALGAKEPAAHESVDVLVATEVLGEGVDLQDARHVVSYDLPWNPVRLLQRIGRVDRLGSPHREVVPHLFVPDDGLDAVLGLTRRLRRKLSGIAGTVGADGALELLASLGRGGPAIEAALQRAADSGVTDPREALRALWHNVERPGPPAEPAASGAGFTRTKPGLVAAALPASAGRRPVVLVAADGRTWLLELAGHGRRARLVEAGGSAVDCVRRALSCAPPDTRPPAATLREIEAAAVSFCRRMEARRRGPAYLAQAGAAARVSRRLRSLVEQEGAAAGPALVARVDRVLTRLARPLYLATERELAGLLQSRQRAAKLGPWLDAVEAVVRSEPAVSADAAPDEEAFDGRRNARAPTLILALVPAGKNGTKNG